MRTSTRRGLAGATFLVLGLGTASNAAAQLLLRGSDTLEVVTQQAVAGAGLGAAITYLGGGSGAGESAMVAGTQHISPMSRQLNSGTSDPKKCTATADQLIIGLDGIAIVAASQTHNDSLDTTPSTADNCTDSVSVAGALKTLSGITKADGVTPCDATDGCSPAGSYTFNNFADVLAMIYGGQNHNTSSSNPSRLTAADATTCTYQAPPNEAAADGPCSAAIPGHVCFPNNKCGDPALVGHRNPASANCLNPVRLALFNTYGNMFSDIATGAGSCRTGSCVKLKHAFRRDDLSGTTDTFDTLTGLPTIANPTLAFIPGSEEIPDRNAIANPLCNGGEAPTNKGMTDYLDLDPIRRNASSLNSGGNRSGLEQVGELVPAFGGNNNDASCMLDQDPTTAGVQPAIPQHHGSANAALLPDPNIPNSLALLQTDLGKDPTVATGLLPSPYSKQTRICLGAVLPITVPANYLTAQMAYFADPSNNPVVCDALDPPGVGPGVAFASVVADRLHGASLCPDGTPQPCLLPYKVDPTQTSGKNFNCVQAALNPLRGGIQDLRVFNLHPVDVNGHYVLDNYVNGSIPTTNNTVGIVAGKQNRVVTAYYRLHVTSTDNTGGSVPTGGPCQTFDSTLQIGCLVKANSCNIGFAGRTAVDDFPAPAQNFALLQDGIVGSTLNIQNLATGGTPVYPLSRKLFLNSIVGFASPLVTAPESALFSFESVPANIDPIILANNFVQVPATVTRLVGCPATNPAP